MSQRLTGLSLLFMIAACGPVGTDLGPSPDDEITDPLTGITGIERNISFISRIYTPLDSSDEVIAAAIRRQVKTALGSLRAPMVALNDRDAQGSLNPAEWTRRTVNVVDPYDSTAVSTPILEVTFPYVDRAVVTTTLNARSAIDFTVLFGDYVGWADGIRRICSDDPAADTGSLWYHFEPQSASCQAAILAENAELDAEARALHQNSHVSGVIGPKDAARRFLTLTAKLGPPQRATGDRWPEYDRLYGLGDDSKRELVVYVFMGVDGYAPADAYNPNDSLAVEAMKLLRTLVRGLPNLRPVHTEPFAMLLDITVDGQLLGGVTYDRLLTWIIDQTDLPSEVGSDRSKILDLRRQALAKFAERRIEWLLPVAVRKPDGTTKEMGVRIITYYGQEDGTPEARQHATWRYLEAFWHGDVFVYNGHSHFGHGPLEPTAYGPENFNARYQVMLVNSCLSFNYYHQDFFGLKPGETNNLDMVVNGLPSWVRDGGVASGRFIVALLSAKPKSYREIVDGMRLDLPWAAGYDPMRVADGELDNVFVPGTLSVVPLTPVHP